MVETHLFQHLAAFLMAMWWSAKWMINRPVSRWRFAISALAGAILWLYVAFTATQSAAASNGTVITYQSLPLAYFAGFMSFVSVVGMILGLALWTEEQAQEAGENIPSSVKSALGDD